MRRYVGGISNKVHGTVLVLRKTHGNIVHSALFLNNVRDHTVKWNNFCTGANSSAVETLISIFTRRPLSLESLQLQDLSSKLTPEIVEKVLKSLQDWRLARIFFNWVSNQEGYVHSCYTYNAMAAILANARQNAPLRELAAKVPNSGVFWTPGALGYFLRCLGGQGMVKEANCLFDEMKNSRLCVPTSYSYNCLLEAISKTGEIGLMECRLNEMKNLGLAIDKHALTPALQCYCNDGNFESALMVFNEMCEKGWVDQHVSTILLLCYSKSGNLDSAFELIDWIERNLKFSLNEKTFCVLIHGLVRNFRLEKALQLYDKMTKVGYVPDISIYDVLIGSLCRNKEIEKALMLYTHMKEFGIIPDVRIISQLLSCIPDESDMIRLLKERWESLNEEKRTQLYVSVLMGFVSDGYVDKAYHLLKRSMRPGENVDTQSDKTFLVNFDTNCFQAVINGLCKTDKLDLALDLFYDMDQSNCKRNVLLFNDLIDCLSHADRLDECFGLLNMMKSSEFQPTHFTFNSIFGCLCRRMDVAGALDILREMRARGHEPWIKYYALLVEKLCEHGRPVEARDFLADMTKVGFFPDMVAYSVAIDGFINMDNLNQSLDLFKEICEWGYCPDVVSYNIIIKGLCKVKRITEAEDILKEMRGKGLIPSVVTYNLLIDAWCKDGVTDQAFLWFSKMRKEEQEPNVITYTTLVDGLLNVGKSEDALNLWIEMERKGCEPTKIAYMALIHGLCNCKKPDVALFYLQKMEEKEIIPDAYIYKGLIVAFESNSNHDMVHMILEKMVKHGITS